MASRALTQRLQAVLRRRAPTTLSSPKLFTGRPYSTADNPPPLLQKLKGDLKTAMRAKDAPRLSVLRAILSTTLNASKTANPIRTDAQLVSLLRKTQRSSLDAAKEFKGAGREDLAGKEEEQAGILDEYISGSGIQVLGEEELKALVGEAIEGAKAAGVAPKAIVGDVMKRLAVALDGKDVDRKQLSNMVRQMSEA